MGLLTEFLSKLSKKIEITVHEVKIDNLSEKLNGLTIAQISDLHITEWNIDLIEHTIEVVNRLKPDIVTMTGDAICNGKKFLPCLTTLFKEIDSKYGKFTCIGNHDHSDGDGSAAIQHTYRKANFHVLMNCSAGVNIQGETIYFAGADDIELGKQNIVSMTKNIPPEAKSIFLTHNPLNFDQLTKFNPDLVLAGHTHGGQIIPAISKFLYKHLYKSDYISGFYKTENSLLYVNRGIGTALLSPLILNKKLIINTPRICSKPEISLFRLVPNKMGNPNFS
ncbi:MAG: metallophosphoesterase [Candidatus Gastranaerophilales bacterium]|nr:metallophosphoesterase [Candidatus Gastranaerophilales bacterium]